MLPNKNDWMNGWGEPEPLWESKQESGIMWWKPKFKHLSSKDDKCFLPTNHLNYLKEDTSYVPRFFLKDLKAFRDIPVNRPVKPSVDVIKRAIEWGMIFLVNYKGEKDKHFAGHERVVYPMVLGKSSKGKTLLRVYHLKGWSVSSNNNIDKVWRLFRMDRILSITFVGSFYRLAPDGYKMNDSGMRGGIIAAADFNKIRKNQDSLIKQGVVQDQEEVTLGKKDTEAKKSYSVIQVSETDTELDLENIFENPYLSNAKRQDLANLRVSFLKPTYGNDNIAILGALGETGNKVKVTLKGGRLLGNYIVLDATTGDVLEKLKKVKGPTVFKLYMFDKKVR